MRIPARIVALVVLLWLGAMLLWELQKQTHTSGDSTRVVGLFIGLMLVGTGIAILIALTVVPAIGESVGAFFFAPKEEIRTGPHDAAISRLALGDPEGALSEYQRVVTADPEDSLAYSEMARICCRDLGDTARAAALLEAALERDWPPEKAAFLANRLADIYLEQGNKPHAQTILQMIVDTLPHTKYAASAHHRIGMLIHGTEKPKG